MSSIKFVATPLLMESFKRRRPAKTTIERPKHLEIHTNKSYGLNHRKLIIMPMIIMTKYKLQCNYTIQNKILPKIPLITIISVVLGVEKTGTDRHRTQKYWLSSCIRNGMFQITNLLCQRLRTLKPRSYTS